jgi:hypothetical protein
MSKMDTPRMPEARTQKQLIKGVVKKLPDLMGRKSRILKKVKTPILVINHMIWEELETFFHANPHQFWQHYKNGVPFRLYTNSCNLTRRIYFDELDIEDALESDHPIFLSFRSLWYKTTRPTLLKIKYITKIENHKVGDALFVDDEGRGNFHLTINIKDFLFAQPTFVGKEADLAVMPKPNGVFLRAIDPLEKSYPYALINNIKENSLESGAAKPQLVNLSVPTFKEKKERNEQVIAPTSFPQKKGENNFTTPEMLPELVNYAAALNKEYVKTNLTKEFFNALKIRFNERDAIFLPKKRTYANEFIPLLLHCKQADEADFEPAYSRLWKIITDKPTWLRKKEENWMFTPEQYLSVEKRNGTDEFIYTSGSIRAYHDRYILPNRHRISVDLSKDLVELFDKNYARLRNIGVSDKFLRKQIEKIGGEAVAKEVIETLTRMPIVNPDSKGDYIRKRLKDAADKIIKAAKEKAKPVASAVSDAAKSPQTTFQMGEKALNSWLIQRFGATDAALLDANCRYRLRVNCTSQEGLEKEAMSVLAAIKATKSAVKGVDIEQIVAQLLEQHPSVKADIEADFKMNARFNHALRGKEAEFMEKQLIKRFPFAFSEAMKNAPSV